MKRSSREWIRPEVETAEVLFMLPITIK